MASRRSTHAGALSSASALSGSDADLTSIVLREVVDLFEDDSEEDACWEVSPPPRPPPAHLRGDFGDDLGDGLVLVGTSGGLLIEDLPHARADCSLRSFVAGAAKRTVGDNQVACAHCWCYVCQQPVVHCRQWTSLDTARPAHCNAHGGNVIWKRMKRVLQTVTARLTGPPTSVPS